MQNNNQETLQSQQEPQIMSESIVNNLNPCDIDPRKILNPELQLLAKERLDKWVENIQEKVYSLLEENGIETYELCFYHKGTGTPILNARGTNYNVAKLAVSAARSLKKQIDEELHV